MRSIAAIVFAVLALVASAYNTVPVQAPARPTAATSRVGVSPIAATGYYDAGLDNPEVRAHARAILDPSWCVYAPPHHHTELLPMSTPTTLQIPEDNELQPPRKCASCFG